MANRALGVNYALVNPFVFTVISTCILIVRPAIKIFFEDVWISRCLTRVTALSRRAVTVFNKYGKIVSK